MKNLIYQCTNADNSKIAKLYYDSEWSEYMVELYINGKHKSKADYHTSDVEDAKITASLIVESSNHKKGLK